jgi:hypothetical protein
VARRPTHIDLYLLHWRDEITDLSGVVKSFEDLRGAGKIRAWGVSNFTARDMEDLFHTRQGDRCATNQVPYNVGDRSIEYDLLPWCEQHSMPIMAYSPLGGPGASVLRDSTLASIGAARACSAAAVALAWTMRKGKRHCNSRIWFGGACKRERRRALTHTDTAGVSNTGYSASAAWPLMRRTRGSSRIITLPQLQHLRGSSDGLRRTASLMRTVCAFAVVTLINELRRRQLLLRAPSRNRT